MVMAKANRKRKAAARKRLVSRAVFLGGGAALLAAVVVGGFLAFSGGGSTASRRALRPTPVVNNSAVVSIDVVDSDYDPKVLQIKAGATATWHFVGDLPHTVTDDNGTFDSGTLAKGDEYVQTFDKAGLFTYYCTIHHAMTGRITVSE